MDTSTSSHTDSAIHPYLPITSSALVQSVEPAQEWFTRLLSPLTAQLSSEPASSASTGALAKLVPAKMIGDAKMNLVGTPPTAKAVAAMAGGNDQQPQFNAVLLVIIPVLVVVLTMLLGLVVFLVAVLYMKKKRGIRLTEDGGPLDLSKGDGVIGEGGTEGVEARWLETVEPDVREGYRRAKDWQASYPPASVPTDITLSQFLSIQEKGVSAWSFEPDYEDNLSLYVQSRTEITFMADGPGMAAREGGGNTVLANLPLPKLNEVYYFEVKIYEKSPNTEVAIGLATKPYPSFRLPGWNKFSVAYFASDGFKSHNYPFTAASHGAPLAEGDILGVGYRPRTGTVFFTRNGRKMEDAYTGLQRLNLFPAIGANGPCTIHVNLGQAGFVFIEAQVKKWGLAPMTGTLAPPPAYGSERGSILLEAGYGTPGANQQTHAGVNALLEAARARSAGQFGSSFGSNASSTGRFVPAAAPASPRPSNSSRRHRRAGKAVSLAGSMPAVPSPLRAGEAGPGPRTTGSRRRALGRAAADSETTYVSPTDTPTIGPRVPREDALEHLLSDGSRSEGEVEDEDRVSAYESSSEPGGRRHSLESPSLEHNPPTPNLLDISMHSLPRRQAYFSSSYRQGGGEDGGRTEYLDVPEPEDGDGDGSGSGESGESDATARPTRLTLGPPRHSPPPPGYAPLDPHVYRDGLPADLPEDLVNEAIAAMSDSPPGGGSRAQEQNQQQTSGSGRFLGWLRGGSNSAQQ